jgi:hypothetical protein
MDNEKKAGRPKGSKNKNQVKIYKPTKPGKTKLERKRKVIEDRLAYNEERASQFRKTLMQNSIVGQEVSLQEH